MLLFDEVMIFRGVMIDDKSLQGFFYLTAIHEISSKLFQVTLNKWQL